MHKTACHVKTQGLLDCVAVFRFKAAGSGGSGPRLLLLPLLVVLCMVL